MKARSLCQHGVRGLIFKNYLQFLQSSFFAIVFFRSHLVLFLYYIFFTMQKIGLILDQSFLFF